MSLLDTVEPCPFCGKKPDMGDPDTFYPSGFHWRDDEEIGIRTYHLRSDYKEGDGTCYVMHCTVQAGGCGAEMHGDSKEETLTKWNMRPKVESLLSQCRIEVLLEAAVLADAWGEARNPDNGGHALRNYANELRRMAESTMEGEKE